MTTWPLARYDLRPAHVDLDFQCVVPEAKWEKHLLREIVRAKFPQEIHNRGGPTFVSYTQYDTNGWFTVDLHEPDEYIPEPTRTGEYTGLCCVAKVVSPPCVTVYWLVETISGWSSGLTSHSRPEPEPDR